MIQIHFYVKFHTVVGQSILVSGNVSALGDAMLEKAIPLSWLNNDYWHGSIEVDPASSAKIQYKYVLRFEDGYHIAEWGNDRVIDITKKGLEAIRVIDTWNHAGEFENVFYTDPFQRTLLKEQETRIKIKHPKNFTHIFRIKAPLLQKNEIVCLLGNHAALGAWNLAEPVMLSRENGWWSCKVNITGDGASIAYKYGVYNIKNKHFVRFEGGDGNRSINVDVQPNSLTILHDGFIHLPNSTWKGAGVAIPVFSLRSKNSFGVGEFNDLRLLVDWAKKTGLKLIQVLPVNDTIATNTWVDTYPYAAISAFALHPVYLNLEDVAGKDFADLVKPLKKRQKQLNELADVDYEQVIKLKLSVMRELFNVQKEDFLQNEEFRSFFDANKDWLIPYAAFCYLRDRNGTSDFSKWKLYSTYSEASIEKYVSSKARHYNHIAFHYFTQYHLHCQLKAAADYAHKQGIILKGDIPIGVYRYGCDAWVQPELYHMDMQSGAPPDDFASRGQNWGFPTYNWERMAEDGFEWWRRRFQQMSYYYDAFRIDHILGFFRIWSIPVESVEGIMGRFVPAIPVHVSEFAQWNTWFDYDRYCKPHINDGVLWELFGPNNEKFKPFLDITGAGTYQLKPVFSTQRAIEQHFESLESNNENDRVKQGLFDLASNVVLFEEPGSGKTKFHFRFGVNDTTSYRHLDDYTKKQLWELYVNYFFRRQDDFWMKEAMKKLPALKQSTNMLVCGEDLGLVPHCVPDAMKQLGILSLEIQRMPKTAGREFFHPADAPYLSVVTPSTHDMSTIRGWWEEDRAKTQRFFNNELGMPGEAPLVCEPFICKAIIAQHLYSPAMWSIFLLQDLLAMSEQLRRKDPDEERINVPAIPKYHWTYRMHLNLEDLLREKEFNHELNEYVNVGGR